MNNTVPFRIFRIKQLIELLGLSRATIYRLMACGKFPKQVKLGQTAVGWDAADIVSWVAERKLASGI